MKTKILVPIDFSDNSLNAIRYALALYADSACTFYLMHIYQIDPFSMQTSAYILPEKGEEPHDLAKRKAEGQFQEFLKDLQPYIKNPNHQLETIITYDLLVNSVKELVAKQDIDMVVMGTKGKTGAATAIFGTNAINIMQGIIECPVLAVPENIEIKPPKEIVFPTDYEGPFKRRELGYMIDIAQMHEGHICVLHVKESKELTENKLDCKALLESILEDVDHSFHELEGVGVQDGINTFVNSRGSDMIAFTNQKQTFFSSIFSNPLVKKLGYHSKVPILVLKNRK